MPSILLSDNGVSSGSAGLKSTAASDGVLVLQTTTSGGTATNAIYVDNNQQVGLGTSAPDNILHLYASAPRLTFTATNNSSGARYNTLGTATTGAHRFQYGGTDVLVAGITGYTTALQGASSVAGTGISFPATQSPSSDANTLDDYEEGTWTPSLGGNTTYTARSGAYTKVGNLVSLSFDIQVSTIGTGSTRVITNIPFTAAVGPSAGGGIGYFDLAASTISVILCRIDGGTTNIVIDANTVVSQNLAGVAVFGNGTRLIGTVTYRAA